MIGRLDDDAFYLTENVYVSQKDIRQFQLAKSEFKHARKCLGRDPSASVFGVDNVTDLCGIIFKINSGKATGAYHLFVIFPVGAPDNSPIVELAVFIALSDKLEILFRKFA